MKKITFHGLALLLGLGLLSCDFDPITTPSQEESSIQTVSEGIPTDQINWVSWKPEVIQRIRALHKGSVGMLIIASEGGTVGGPETFDNAAYFPAGALVEDTYVTVDVLCVDGDQQCGAGVEYLPSGQFLKNVTVALSYGYLNYSGDPLDLDAYFSQDGATWFPVNGMVYDTTAETATFETDHFTLFGWAD